MKKICILSMQKVDNFGSLLQSYSLKNIVERLDNVVKFIDIESYDEDCNLLINSEDYSKEAVQNRSKLSKIDKYFLNRLKIKMKNKMQNKLFEEFRQKYLNIKEENNRDMYDTCIIGSDEVFNCNVKSKWGFTSQLFGNVKNAKKVITYAASCGSTRYNNVNQNVLKKIRKSFENISAFSVRDENTYNFVTKLSNNSVEYNLDPVLIYDFKKEIMKNSNVRLPKKFCILYSYYNRFNSQKEIDYISKYCKKNNMDLITLGAPQFWVKKHMVMNPFQMLYTFSKAEMVITDTFHGTIFASKYSKKFITIVRSSNKNKLCDLLNRLNKGKHLFDYNKSFDDNTYFNDINDTDKIIELELDKSLNYLKNNI